MIGFAEPAVAGPAAERRIIPLVAQPHLGVDRDAARNERKMSRSEGANRRRSERVMLQIPIIVSTESVEGEQMQEETQTMVVNAHGGLVKLQMEVMPGQPIMLRHPRSGVEAEARVVRVENGGKGSVEHIRISNPNHPIAKGIKDFDIPQTEIYGEPFEVPMPETIVFYGHWDSGPSFPDGC